MKITGFSPISMSAAQTKIQADKNQNQTPNYSSKNFAYPKNYYISFEGRVDKGLERFCEQNSDYMPRTVKEYLNTINVKYSNMTPLEAQQKAFEYLNICDTVEEVKLAYPDEPLFENLMSTDETKSKRGLLYDIKVLKDDLSESGEPIAGEEKDLTMYLLKKVYLEGKTVGEINEDLDNDINPIFKREDKNYILGSTLSSLGIKLPKPEYLTSLRYTRDGYSDKMGEKHSTNWQNLSEEEKFRRIEILTSNRGEISPEKRAEMREKRSIAMKKFWQDMTAEKRVQFIENMQSGNNDHQKLAMISAWNKCPEIRDKMSDFFAERKFYNPQNIIYRDSKYSEAMSNAMKEFWAQNPECADILGDAIKTAYTEIDIAKENGAYDKYAKEVLDEQKVIKTEIKNRRKANKAMAQFSETIIIKMPKERLFGKSAKEEYLEICHNRYPFIPENILDKYFAPKINAVSEDDLKVKIKALRDEPLTAKEEKMLEKTSNLVVDLDIEATKVYNAMTDSLLYTLFDCMEDNTPIYLQDTIRSTIPGILLEYMKMAVTDKQKVLPILDNDGYQIENYKMKLKRTPTAREVAGLCEREYIKQRQLF